MSDIRIGVGQPLPDLISTAASVAFNAITGLFDTPVNSERTTWIEGDAREIGPNTFSEDLLTVGFAEGGTLRFKREALLEHHDNFLVIRSDYFHWFGTYSGMLPGGIELTKPLVFSNVMMPCGNLEFH